MTPAGEQGTPRPGRAPRSVPGAGYIECCICNRPIPRDQYSTGRCWTDPNGITCAAHAACLLRVGEQDLRLA